MSAGSVLFRGTLPPRAEEFDFLRREGIDLNLSSPKEAHWGLSMSHPKWGPADLICLQNAPVPPATLVEYSAGMTNGERREVLAGRSMVSITSRHSTGDVLRDRKGLLWYLRRVMGDDGVGAMDHGAQRFWPRAALDFELGHDAPLDIESLFVIHAITDANVPGFGEQQRARPDGEEAPRPRPYWVHTHGLDQLGAFDFDLLDPSDAIAGDCFRSLAYAVLEGEIQPAAASFTIAQPGGTIRMVPAEQFMRTADAKWRAKRDTDPEHNTNRSVVCNPVGGLGRLFGGKPTPSRFFMRDDLDQCVFGFSGDATDQMAERARLTMGMCRLLHHEFADFDFPCLVKIGYPTDKGGTEHLWFRVHDFGGDDVDATLLNQPFDIAAMSEGQRGRHSLENLSDWQITTPVGSMSPRDTEFARTLRENPEAATEMLKIVKMMREVGMA